MVQPEMTTQQLVYHVGRPDKHICSALVRLANIMWIWHARMCSRQSLVQLSDHALKDIGLSRAGVYWESSKPFWSE
jgi:uncharacterized protein YjiS (DUF1127 family)